MRWYSIDHLPRLAKSYHRLVWWRRWALVVVRSDPPNVDQSRTPGEGSR